MGIQSIHQELGNFIVLFQTMDNAVNDVIYHISGNKGFVAEAFITKTEFTSKMEIADVIFSHFIDTTTDTDEEAKGEFHSLMNRCKKIGTERNVIVHSIYYPLTKVDGSEQLIQKNPRLKFKGGPHISDNDKELAIEDFEQINKKITEVIEEIDKFRLKLIAWKYPI